MRKLINDYLKAKIEAGAVRDRADVLAALREAGRTSTVRDRIAFPSKTPTAGKRYG